MIHSTFPRIAHLPGSSHTPEDLLFSDEEARPFLEQPVTVFEKLDGVNVTLRRVGKGGARVAFGLKPEWRGVLGGRLERALDIWLRQRERQLLGALGPRDVVYGEWLWHRVSVRYHELPSLFIGFSWRGDDDKMVAPRECRRRLERAGITPAEPVFEGTLGSLKKLRSLVRTSRYGDERMEGLVVERTGWPRFAKWVEPGYAHPTTGELSGERNLLAGA